MAVNPFPPQAYTRDMLATAYEWLRSQPQNVRELAKDSDSLVALYMQSRRRSEQRTTSTASSEAFKKDLKDLAEGLKQFEDPSASSAGMPQEIIQSSAAGVTQTPSSHSQHLPQGHNNTNNFFHSAPTQQQTANPHAAGIFAPPQVAPQSAVTHGTQQVVNAQAASMHTAQPQVSMHGAPLRSHSTHNYNPQTQTHGSQGHHLQSPQAQYSQSHAPQHNQSHAPQHNQGPVQQSHHFAHAPTSPSQALDQLTRERIRLVQSKLNLSSEGEALRLLVSIGFDQVVQWLPKN